jgi:hypothetical protein
MSVSHFRQGSSYSGKKSEDVLFRVGLLRLNSVPHFLKENLFYQAKYNFHYSIFTENGKLFAIILCPALQILNKP